MHAFNVSVTAQMERSPGSQEPKYNTKSHCATNLTQESYWEGRKYGGWMPLRKQGTAEN